MQTLRNLATGIRAAFGDPRVRVLLAMTATLIGVAATFYHWAEGWGWLDSIYFSVITISTVGYGDFSPQTAIGKGFTIFYILVGLGLFVACATAIADSIITRGKDKNGTG